MQYTGQPPRSFILHEANLKQLRDDPPNVAVLPWGATEAHGFHLPYGTDVIEATAFAHQAATIAREPLAMATRPAATSAATVRGNP